MRNHKDIENLVCNFNNLFKIYTEIRESYIQDYNYSKYTNFVEALDLFINEIFKETECSVETIKNFQKVLGYTIPLLKLLFKNNFELQLNELMTIISRFLYNKIISKFKDKQKIYLEIVTITNVVSNSFLKNKTLSLVETTFMLFNNNMMFISNQTLRILEIYKKIKETYKINHWSGKENLCSQNYLLTEEISINKSYELRTIELERSFLQISNILTNDYKVVYSNKKRVAGFLDQFNLEEVIEEKDNIISIYLFEYNPKNPNLKSPIFFYLLSVNMFDGSILSLYNYQSLSDFFDCIDSKNGLIYYEILRSLILTEIANLLVPTCAIPNLEIQRKRSYTRSKRNSDDVEIIINQVLLPMIKSLQDYKYVSNESIQESRDYEYEESGRLIKVRAHLRRLNQGQKASKEAISFGKQISWEFDHSQFTLVRSFEKKIKSHKVVENNLKIGVYRNKF